MITKTKIKPVTFLNRKGFKLFGMLHTPPQPRRDVGIIILSPGIKNRVAPHRLYVKMARRFTEMGFQVLRFDPEGLGDSEGEIKEQFTSDLYGSIQVGRFIEDTVCAMDWMEKELKLPRFILSGLCGGAITGLLTGANDKRVDSLLSLGIPVILDSSNIDPSRYISKGQLRSMGKSYVRKIVSPQAWIRFITFQSDYRIILKSLKQTIGFKNTKNDNTSGQTVRSETALSAANFNNNLNPNFPLALHKMIVSRKVLLIFSEADRLYWEFEEKYMPVYKNEFEKYRNKIEIKIVKDANHIFSFTKWQQDMLERSCEWIIGNHPN